MLGHLEHAAVGIHYYVRAKRTRGGNSVIGAWEEQSWGEGTIQGELELWKEATSVKTTLPQEVGNGETKYPDIYLLPTTLAKPNQKPVYKGAWMTQSLESSLQDQGKERQENGSWVVKWRTTTSTEEDFLEIVKKIDHRNEEGSQM